MRRVGAAVFGLFLAAGGAEAAVPPPVTVTPIAAGQVARPLSFAKLVTRLNSGDRWGSYSGGVACLDSAPLFWKGDLSAIDDETDAVVREEIEKAGFKMAGDPRNLFETADGANAEYAIGGAITALSIDTCEANLSTRQKGSSTLTVEWQIYSRLKREVVGKVTTSGAFEQKTFVDNAASRTFKGALADSARGLINSEAFRQAATGAPAVAAGGAVAATATRPPISFAKPTRKPAAMSDVVGSVVTVLAGDGHGSGFLISDDGYLLTNAHVTVGSKYVKIRWGDKFEGVGEVIREEKGRDIALIKTDTRGRTPLTLRRTAPEVGLEVYAIGAPILEQFQGTVTRGIVSSGTRIFNNYSFIQSDVAVNPGNSGGPLVTKEGEVLGITVLGIRPEGTPTGINLFIPAGDAMDFLGLQ